MCSRVNHNIAKSIVDVRYHSLTIMIEQHFFNNFLVVFLGQEEGASPLPEEYEYPTMEQLGEQVSRR